MIHRLLTILFPSPCFACGFLEESLCSDCQKTLVFTPHIRRINDLKICSALLYKKQALIEQLIESFKYKHQSNLARFLGPKMTEALRLFHTDTRAILVPVPLHPHRERERGYNQAEQLARVVSNHLGFEMHSLLRRKKNTLQQARLKHRQERQENLVGAFETTQILPKGRQLILVDDIVTTGSTLLECKRTLQEAGADSVLALSLANRDDSTTYPWH